MPEYNKTKLSIVLVNYNARRKTEDCIRSIYDKTKNIPIEIILIDNASSDGDRASFQEEFPKIILIENANNKGFAYANNQAIKISSGKYALLLNKQKINAYQN